MVTQVGKGCVVLLSSCTQKLLIGDRRREHNQTALSALGKRPRTQRLARAATSCHLPIYTHNTTLIHINMSGSGERAKQALLERVLRRLFVRRTPIKLKLARHFWTSPASRGMSTFSLVCSKLISGRPWPSPCNRIIKNVKWKYTNYSNELFFSWLKNFEKPVVIKYVFFAVSVTEKFFKEYFMLCS